MSENCLNYYYEDSVLTMLESNVETLEVNTEKGLIVIPSALSVEEKIDNANKGFFLFVSDVEGANGTVEDLAALYAKTHYHFTDFEDSVCRFFGVEI